MGDRRKFSMMVLLAVLVAAMGSIGGYYFYNSLYFVTTDDAKVAADLVKVHPQVTGRLLELNIEEGDRVEQDQILGRQEAANLLEVAADQLAIRAPINGIVVKKQAYIGEIVSAGQALAVIVDPAGLYINANIEETHIGKVAPNQPVDIDIDAFPGTAFTGRVETIGEAANSAFSLLPSSAGGTFTKVVQKIPVKIRVNSNGQNLLPGTNSVVKIHIR